MREAGEREGSGAIPLVSVIICTRDRGDNVSHTVRKTLESRYSEIEVLVVDQSVGGDTYECIRRTCEKDSRLRYLRVTKAGKATALNYALTQARGEYLVLTDDDCEPDPDWIPALLAAFRSDPQVACVFGTVKAPDYDEHEFYVPVCPIPESFTIERLKDYIKRPGMDNAGLGANMAIRTDVVKALGGWDPCCGPGERFASGDDYSFAIRILHAGYYIRFCKEALVTHFGFRRHEQIEKDTRRWGFGLGATFAKYLRCGVIARHSLRTFLGSTRRAFLRIVSLRRPFQTGMARGWLRGFWAGVFYPLDKRSLCFLAPDQPEKSDSQENANGELFARIVLRSDQSLSPEAKVTSAAGNVE
jgi:GT2 family glycosyltransferase